MTFELHTGRLILRDVELTDAPLFARYFAEASAQRFILSVQKHPNYIDSMMKIAAQQRAEGSRRDYFLTITANDTGEVLGVSSLNHAERGGLYGCRISSD